MYAATHRSQKRCHRAKMTACAKRAKYKYNLASTGKNILGKCLCLEKNRPVKINNKNQRDSNFLKIYRELILNEKIKIFFFSELSRCQRYHDNGPLRTTAPWTPGQ